MPATLFLIPGIALERRGRGPLLQIRVSRWSVAGVARYCSGGLPRLTRK